MSKNRKQNTANTPEKTLQSNVIEEEVPLKNIHQIKYNCLEISLGLTSLNEINESQYISTVKKDRMFIVHFKIHCRRLTPNTTHFIWYYIVPKNVSVNTLI